MSESYERDFQDGYVFGYEEGLATGYGAGEREHADQVSRVLDHLAGLQHRLKMGTYREEMDGGLLEVVEKVHRMLDGRE